MNQERTNKFVGRLMALYRSDNRAALAKLRRAAPRLPLSTGEVLAVVGDQMAGLNDAEIADLSLVAALFALHPHENGHGSFGLSFRRVWLHPKSNGSDSTKRRFEVLCDADRERLPTHLYGAISLARARGVSVNWFQLATDIPNWSSSDRSVQLRWLKDFFVPPKQSEYSEQKEILDVP